MNLPIGHNAFAWKLKDLPDYNHRDPLKTALAAKMMGFDSLWVKVVNGSSPYNLRWDGLRYVDDALGPFIDACESVGVDVWGFVYYYGDSPVSEAQAVVKRMRDYPKLKGVILDAEGECKAAGVNAATIYIDTIMVGCSAPIGLCSYRYPSLHRDFPWKAFIGKVHFHAPQVYWVGANNSAEQLDKSILEFRNLHTQLDKPMIPFIPTGAAYHEAGWEPTIAEMQQFSIRASDYHALPGISWWEWANAERYGLTSGMTWRGAQNPPPEPPPEEAIMRFKVNTSGLFVRQAKNVSGKWMVDNVDSVYPLVDNLPIGAIFTANYVYAPPKASSSGEAWAIDTATGRGACITLGATQHMESA